MTAPHHRPLGALAALVLLLAGCPDDGAPAGAPCVRAADCESGLCLRDATGPGGACARRCAADADCAGGTVCGRFDYRGRDLDSGVPAGEKSDVVRVCRPPLHRACAAGCGGGGCFGDPAGGVCADRCAADADCRGRTCERAGCEGLCAPPCDTLAECPRGYSCDLAATDLDGHGQCIPIDGRDAGAAPDAGTCDAR